jgi:uncharacterized protein (TIGR02246 family)
MEVNMRKMFGLFVCVLFVSATNMWAQNDDASFRKFTDDMNEKFSKAMLSGDYNTIANMYTDDAVSLQSYEPMWVGKNAILEGNKKDLTESGMKWSNLTGKTTQVFGNDNLKVEIGTFEATFTPPNSTTAMNDHGKYMNVWQKQSDGSWKLRADTWNSDMNPASMNQAGAKPKTDDNTK